MAPVNGFGGIFSFKQTVKIEQPDRTMIKLHFGNVE